ncbi:OTU domain-containing protein [Canna indica]|uniref:ubiquitinyl hydrolase 1 n=1 Tax=Canna indica TaxID=4628 RepID=A0AAQ3KL12_9LILI|nr:OTU domain-containing protein [Canna indica]
MIMCEQDPDMARWGLYHLMDPPLNSTYFATTYQNGARDCSAQSAAECGLQETCDSVENDEIIAHVLPQNGARDCSAQTAAECALQETCVSLENDEIIARALQEELSQVAIAEASGPSYATEEQLQESVLTQNWLPSSTAKNDISGSVPLSELLGDMEASSSNPTSLTELTDDFSDLDGEVCKRLNQMSSVPHIPKINGEIPTVDEEISDHQRLLDRLRLYDLVELKVQGDGNCQFGALSDQLYRTSQHHKFVRQQVVDQLKSHPEIYEGYVPMSYDEYLRKMSKSGEWGDHVTLQAAADSYGVKIFILTSFKDTCYIEILPSVQKSTRVICLSFWAEVHYNSIYPEGGLPSHPMLFFVNSEVLV